MLLIFAKTFISIDIASEITLSVSPYFTVYDDLLSCFTKSAFTSETVRAVHVVSVSCA